MIIRLLNDIDRHRCPLCNGKAEYMSSELRPVFPKERLLIEILLDKPLAFINKSVWANTNRYYIDDEVISITSKHYKKYQPDYLIKKLDTYREQNNYDFFNENINKFIKANSAINLSGSPIL